MRPAFLFVLLPFAAVGQQSDVNLEAVIDAAARVTPSARQLAWQEVEFAAFIHFGMNAFTNREWGEGNEDPALFNPTRFDARQWVAACKAAGMGELILTAKHHDGFCLWPSVYTEHSVKNSPWRDGKGDIVREVADACREAGIRFGVYLSPWDRNQPTYGDSPAYNEYFRNQLRELLTNYGEISEVWFDGACGEGPNGKRQVYDWDSYYALVRELQPNAVISVSGPDVRWCGNEAGKCRQSEWSVIPEGVNAMDEDLGSRDVLLEAAKAGKKLLWHPSQVNTSIRPGWFYHKAQDGQVKSLDHLLDVYYGSVGGNAQFLLNLPPDQRGLIHENDVARLKELGAVLRATFETNLAEDARITASAMREGYGLQRILDGEKDTFWTTDDGVTQAEIEFELPEPRTFNRAMLQEAIAVGQRIEAFALDAFQDGQWRELARATTVGHKRLLRFDDATAQRVRVRILESRVAPTLANFGLFYEPPILKAPKISRDRAGTVTIDAADGLEVRYWLETPGAQPSSSSQRYAGPFAMPGGGIVHAVAIPPDNSRHLRVGGWISHAEFGAVKTKWQIVGKAGMTAVNAIDGDTTTNWIKEPDAPRELVVDMGEPLDVNGFIYIPRQDKPDGRVSRCEFYLADTPADWGKPAAAGKFGNLVNNPVAQTVRLKSPVRARYLRFVPLEEAQGADAVAAAELGVLTAAREDKTAVDKKQLWETLQPDPATETVKRVNEEYPLSDQENKGGWELYEPMTDEFEGDTLDRDKWWDHNPGWLGRQPALFYPGNVDVYDGKLHLSMKKEEAPDMPHDKGYHDYTSAAVKSKDTVRYGYFEVKARPMNSAGSSSFWFYDSADGWWTEIDVFELGARAAGYERKMNITVHVQNTPVTDKLQSIGGAWVAPFNLADDYHVYGFEWNEDELKLYFDGMLVRRGKNTDWHQPLTLNFDSETMPNWFGMPQDEHLPSTYSVEYVRCWKKG